jgi:flagellar protein FlgJ
VAIERTMTPVNAGLASDGRSIDALKLAASKDPKAAIRETAKQFEALFMQQLMKSMRQATMSSGMLDNAGSELGTEMLDTQFATKMTGLPGGLSDLIARQLERQMGVDPSAPLARPSRAPAVEPDASVVLHTLRIPGKQAAFVRQHDAVARQVEADTGIPAAFMLGQAAHETGWGQRDIRHADGSPSHNLFGIKAGSGWQGKVAEITTTEYVDGQPRKVTARFRAYASAEESFRDYARLIGSSPRYQKALAAANAGLQAPATHTVRAFANGLQQAGYATDPAYADKLSRVINTTLSLQRAAI